MNFCGQLHGGRIKKFKCSSVRLCQKYLIRHTIHVQCHIFCILIFINFYSKYVFIVTPVIESFYNYFVTTKCPLKLDPNTKEIF